MAVMCECIIELSCSYVKLIIAANTQFTEEINCVASLVNG